MRPWRLGTLSSTFFSLLLVSATIRLAWAEGNAPPYLVYLPDVMSQAPTSAYCVVESVKNTENSALNPRPVDIPTLTYKVTDVFPSNGGVPRLFISALGGANVPFTGPGAPAANLYEMAPMLRPQSDWVVFVAEMANHPAPSDPSPASLVYSERNGYYGDIWVAKPDGSQWVNLTNYVADGNQLVGSLNPMWSPDSSKLAWAALAGGPSASHSLGDWRLMVADFSVGTTGVPSLINERDITGPSANWNEVEGWSPDGTSLLVSSDSEVPYDYGADDFIVNVATGTYVDVTNHPLLWDEHGSFSPTGEKIAYAHQISPPILPHDASLPYDQWIPLIGSEIWVSNVDGTQAQQITGFNAPLNGVPDPELTAGILSGAVTATWNTLGTQLLIPQAILDPATGLTTSTNWLVTFAAPCG